MIKNIQKFELFHIDFDNNKCYYFIMIGSGNMVRCLIKILRYITVEYYL